MSKDIKYNLERILLMSGGLIFRPLDFSMIVF